jgi:hypothetical protein
VAVTVSCVTAHGSAAHKCTNPQKRKGHFLPCTSQTCHNFSVCEALPRTSPLHLGLASPHTGKSLGTREHSTLHVLISFTGFSSEDRKHADFPVWLYNRVAAKPLRTGHKNNILPRSIQTPQDPLTQTPPAQWLSGASCQTRVICKVLPPSHPQVQEQREDGVKAAWKIQVPQWQ